MLQLEKLEKNKEEMGHKQALCCSTAVKDVVFIRLKRELQSFAFVEDCVEQSLIGTVSRRLEMIYF